MLNTETTHSVGFILLEHFSMMAFTGAVDALVTANLLNASECFSFSFYGEDGESIKSDLSIDVSVNGRYRDIRPAAFDVLFVCGGLRTNLEVHPKLKAVLQQAEHCNTQIGGIWNGSYILAQAGVLRGYECTIHPENHALMTEVFPEVNVSKKPYVIDRDRMSSAGATSTLSMLLNLIGQLTNDDLRHRVAGILDVDSVLGEAADGSQIMLPSDPTFPDALREVMQLMESNIDEPLTTQQLTAAVNLSRRQLERLFQQYLKTSPAKYYLGLRLSRAHQLIRQSNAPMVNIAIACGFNSNTHFSHSFKAHYGIPPSQLRIKS